MYDAIVVGARCAGASTAMLLARQGHRVLLVDRSTFPSDIPHGHFIHSGGPARLRQWGLLDTIIATGCPPITSFTTQWADVRLTSTDVSVSGTPVGIAPRRTALDRVLVEAAVAAGAELREAFTVDAFLTDGDAITGIRGHQRGSQHGVTEHAPITIGADGRHSHLARFVSAPEHDAVPTLTCFYFSYWSGVSDHGTEVYDLGDKVIFLFPTNDRLTGVFVSWPISEAAAVRSDIEGHVMRAIDQVPDLSERIRSGRREEPFRGSVDLPNFLRKPFGTGWALVGDAGCHKDPYLALGCCDAFRDAELLAGAVHSGLSGEQPLDDALSSFERSRDDATMPDYQMNLEMARFHGLPPEQLMLRRSIQDNPAAIRQMYLAMEKLVPLETFFNPENMQRLMSPPASLSN